MWLCACVHICQESRQWFECDGVDRAEENSAEWENEKILMHLHQAI